jgi:hypothetical protein
MTPSVRTQDGWTAMAQLIRTGAWHAPDETPRDPCEK